MLTKQEHEVMSAVYQTANASGSCLISPDELLKMLPEKGGYTPAKLNKILKSLELDDYFDIINSDRKGEPIFCINLHTKGMAYKRTAQQEKRNIYMKIFKTVAFAVLSFVVGRLLFALFT